MGRRTLVVNPAAGGGRCGRRLAAFADRLHGHGHAIDVVRTDGPGHATRLAQQAAEDGADAVVAVGGDGTLFEVVNGLMAASHRPALGILPLGTGNSFARDFGLADPQQATEALLRDQRAPVDVVRADHAEGHLHYINLLSVGFTAEAGALTNRRFKGLGVAGYVAAVLVGVIRLSYPRFAYSLDGRPSLDDPCVLLSFSNSQYTGGQMHMAPPANPADGLLDLIRVDPMSRRRLLTLFPRIFSGTHLEAEEVSTERAAEVVLDLPGPVSVMVDGEVLPLHLSRLTVEPAALELLT